MLITPEHPSLVASGEQEERGGNSKLPQAQAELPGYDLGSPGPSELSLKASIPAGNHELSKLLICDFFFGHTPFILGLLAG